MVVVVVVAMAGLAVALVLVAVLLRVAGIDAVCSGRLQGAVIEFAWRLRRAREGAP